MNKTKKTAGSCRCPFCCFGLVVVLLFLLLLCFFFLTSKGVEGKRKKCFFCCFAQNGAKKKKKKSVFLVVDIVNFSLLGKDKVFFRERKGISTVFRSDSTISLATTHHLIIPVAIRAINAIATITITSYHRCDIAAVTQVTTNKTNNNNHDDK